MLSALNLQHMVLRTRPSECGQCVVHELAVNGTGNKSQIHVNIRYFISVCQGYCLATRMALWLRNRRPRGQHEAFELSAYGCHA